MANLLKEKHTEEVNDKLKLVEIVYAELKFKRVWCQDVLTDADYIAFNYMHKKKVYVSITDFDIQFKMGVTICFHNVDGKEIMRRKGDNTATKQLYTDGNRNDDTEMITVDYDLYTLASCVDV